MNKDVTLKGRERERIDWRYLMGYFFVFMILPPIIGLPLIIGMVWKRRNASKSTYYILFTCLAAYMAAINATKMPGGDQVQYYVAYKNVPDVGLLGSLIWIYGLDVGNTARSISGEFMNGVYNYFGYYLTFGYYPLFAALLTFVDYMLIFLGLYKVCNTLKGAHFPIVCGAVILTFFYLFFNYTLHIQKQFLAQCIMMYVLGDYAAKGNMSVKLWVIAFCAIFTHAATVLFVPFLLYKPLRGRLNKTGLLIMIVLMSAFIILGPGLAAEVAATGDSAVSYSARRFAQSEGQEDAASTLVVSQVIVIALPMFFIVFRQLWMRRKQYIDDSQAFILNIVLLLLVSITAMYNKPMARYRFFMMLIAFMPFVYPFISSSVKSRDIVLKMLSFVMIGWFYFQFEKMIWNYAPEWQIIAYPPFALICIGF